MATAQLPQVRYQRRAFLRPQVVWLAFTGVIAVGLALDIILLAATGQLMPLIVSAERLPRGVLAVAALMLLAVAIPGGRWEAQHLWTAHRLRVRERRIEQLTPLASRLHVSPLRLDAISVKTLHDLSPKEFELAMCDLLTLLQYRDVKHTGRAGDLCADLIATAPSGKHIVAQCKRYAPDHPVGSPEVQTFLGMVTIHHRVPRGLYFTTSSYTRDAVKLAAEHPAHLTLYDGEDLIGMVHALAIR